MSAILVLIPVLVVALMLGAGLLAALFETWSAHRLKMTFLERATRCPDLIASREEADALLARLAHSRRQDLALTGAVLALLGLLSFLLGGHFRVGVLAVGAYYGGIACMWLGAVIGVTGLALRRLRKISSRLTSSLSPSTKSRKQLD